MEALPDIGKIIARKEELDGLMGQEHFFNDSDKAVRLSKEHTRLSQLMELHQLCQVLLESIEKHQVLLNEAGQDEELREMLEEELEAAVQKYPLLRRKLLLALLPPHKDDSRNTVVEIRAGAGGDEASLFAAKLHRLYKRYAESQNWTVENLGSRPSEAGGFKEIAFLIKGEGVYQKLKYESGVHRVQRIPITEGSGRIHTSTATVAVLPEAKEVELKLDPSELDISTARASGAGGQHVNKTESAVQILHKRSGLIVYCADERSQRRNRDKAMQVLRARLLERQAKQEAERYARNRRDQIGTADRSERIRTYNFPQGRLTDHRIALTLYHLSDIMEGALDPVLKALEEADNVSRLEAFLDSQGT